MSVSKSDFVSLQDLVKQLAAASEEQRATSDEQKAVIEELTATVDGLKGELKDSRAANSSPESQKSAQADLRGRFFTEAIRSVRPFSGVPGRDIAYPSPVAFIRKVEDLQDYYKVADSDLVKIFSDKLEDRALVWWHSYYPAGSSPRLWGEVRQAFLRRWNMQAHSERALQDKLYGDGRLRQKSSSREDLELLLGELHTALEALSTSATKPPPTGEALVGILWGMLHPDLQEALKLDRRRCNTMDDLQTLALDAALPAGPMHANIPAYVARVPEYRQLSAPMQFQPAAHPAPVAMSAGASAYPPTAYADPQDHTTTQMANLLSDPTFLQQLADAAQLFRGHH